MAVWILDILCDLFKDSIVFLLLIKIAKYYLFMIQTKYKLINIQSKLNKLN